MSRSASHISMLAMVVLTGCSSPPPPHSEPLPPTIISREHLELHRRLYHLDDREFFGGPANEWAAQLQALYLYLLEQCQLPSLYRQRGHGLDYEYRLIVFPSGHGDKTPFCVRVHEQDGEPWISKYWFGQYDEKGLLAAVECKSRSLGTRDLKCVQSRLDAIGFWSMQRIDTDVPLAMHEGHFFFEALAGDRYHCVDRGAASDEATEYLEFCVGFGNKISPALQY